MRKAWLQYWPAQATFLALPWGFVTTQAGTGSLICLLCTPFVLPFSGYPPLPQLKRGGQQGGQGEDGIPQVSLALQLLGHGKRAGEKNKGKKQHWCSLFLQMLMNLASCSEKELAAIWFKPYSLPWVITGKYLIALSCTTHCNLTILNVFFH